MNQVVFCSVELVSSQHITHIYVYSFETITFTESHIQCKYHRLVPDPLWPDIHAPTTLVMPFNPLLDFTPTFASDECGYLALSSMGSMKLQVSDIRNANITPLDERSRKTSFVRFLKRHYPYLDISEEQFCNVQNTMYHKTTQMFEYLMERQQFTMREVLCDN